MRIFVLEDDFPSRLGLETTIEKLLKEHHIIPSSFEGIWEARPTAGRGA